MRLSPANSRRAPADGHVTPSGSGGRGGRCEQPVGGALDHFEDGTHTVPVYGSNGRPYIADRHTDRREAARGGTDAPGGTAVTARGGAVTDGAAEQECLALRRRIATYELQVRRGRSRIEPRPPLLGLAFPALLLCHADGSLPDAWCAGARRGGGTRRSGRGALHPIMALAPERFGNVHALALPLSAPFMASSPRHYTRRLAAPFRRGAAERARAAAEEAMNGDGVGAV